MLKTSKMTAVSMAFAVWLTYSFPARSASIGYAGSNIPSTVSQTDDDDEDGLSGGALAVLLLAIGGAVAGVLYAGRTPNKNDGIVCKRLSDEMTVTTKSTDQAGKQKRTEWKAKLDEKSGTIKLTKSGGRTIGQWLGKADGKYYPVTGDREADELSFTKAADNAMEFSARKAGKVTLSGRMVVSPNGHSVTLNTARLDSAGRQVISQTVFSAP